MVQTVMNFLYIGNFADVDTDETNWTAENASSLLGTHDAIAIVPITADDADNDGIIYDDESGTTESLSYDVGGGPVSTLADSSMLFNTTVLLGDGTTRTLQLLVVQTQTGDVFVRDTTGGDSLDNLNIQSITFDSVANADGSGFLTSESVENSSVVCFAAGTLIDTPEGPRPVEGLRPGDKVHTLDAGPQPICWVGSWHRARAERHAYVIIAPDVFGPGKPQRALRLSPQHRVLIRSRIAQRMFETPEVFVAARKLLGLPGVTQAPPDTPAQYHHIACDRHHVVIAEGLETETLLPGHEAMRSLSAHQVDGLVNAMKLHDGAARSIRPARHCPTPRQQKNLISRMIKNGRRRTEGRMSETTVQAWTLV